MLGHVDIARDVVASTRSRSHPHCRRRLSRTCMRRAHKALPKLAAAVTLRTSNGSSQKPSRKARALAKKSKKEPWFRRQPKALAIALLAALFAGVTQYL